MEIFNRDKRDGYEYDPIIKGYDASFFATTAGAPAISGTALRFNASAAASYLMHTYADVEFLLNIPAVPTSGDARQFGFLSPESNNLGALYFDITGAVFSVKMYDDSGNLTSTTLTFTAGWAATATSYRLRWEPDQVVVLIAGAVVATINLSGGNIPNGPLPVRIKNGNADNMDLSYLRVRRAAGLS